MSQTLPELQVLLVASDQLQTPSLWTRIKWLFFPPQPTLMAHEDFFEDAQRSYRDDIVEIIQSSISNVIWEHGESGEQFIVNGAEAVAQEEDNTYSIEIQLVPRWSFHTVINVSLQELLESCHPLEELTFQDYDA